ncbi:hypothetical protein AruPA_10960 [Acidiphilium sp. PA]|nr:hypothetical protein [Acidiphilium sp. PA]MCW8307558.1 hypothetical protein [Acidiphilium sp. PA]
MMDPSDPVKTMPSQTAGVHQARQTPPSSPFRHRPARVTGAAVT